MREEIGTVREPARRSRVCERKPGLRESLREEAVSARRSREEAESMKVS